MPTLSASDYTTYLKFKAAAASQIRPSIQTRDNVALSQSVINANVFASQAAFVVTPTTTRIVTNAASVSAASTTTVTAARTDVLSGAVGNGTIITYTSSQSHGLSAGTLVTITGFTVFTAANVTAAAVTVTGPTTFTVAVAATGTATGTGSITGRVYYTTSVANGLTVGETISVTGITTFTAAGLAVLAVPDTTHFVLSSSTTGAAVSGQTGSITGRIYYTTTAAHDLEAGLKNVSITGLSAFNQSFATVLNVPSTTVFTISSATTGAAITGQTGVLVVTYYTNTTTSIRGNASVRAIQPSRSNNPNALSTLTGSGTMSSSAVARTGGLPVGFKGSQGAYHRIPQNAGWA